jgi:protein-S-isoprenylcysteine O-methyltransferase Ste14
VSPGAGHSFLFLLRHLFAVAVLPVTMTIVVPVWIARRYGVRPRLPTTAADVAAVIAGAALLAIGAGLFSASLARFASDGRGTLAPWDPPRQLVLRGPYRYVRNPMIAGVIFVLAAEALVLRSWPHGIWAAIFLGINLLYIPLFEEPQLEHRFGEEYRRYCRHVARIVPRLRPWRGEDE